MAGIYSVRLGTASATAGTASTIYTAPSGFTIVVRCISLTNDTGGSGTGLVALASGPVLASSLATGDLQTEIFDLRHVLEAGDVLRLTALTTTWSCIVSGYQLVP